MIFLKFICVFVLMTVLDFVWAQYIKYTAAADPLRSAIAAVLIYAFGCTVTLAYIDDHSMIFAALLGSFVGTYLSVWHAKRNTKKQDGVT